MSSVNVSEPATTTLVEQPGNQQNKQLAPIASMPARTGNLTILDLAKHAYASGMFKKLPNASAAVMILQLGRDLGVSDTASLTSIHFFEGKPTMSGNMLWGLVLRDREYRKSHVVKKNDKEVAIRWIREITNPDGSIDRVLDIIDTYTEEDAKLAGLLGKDVWKKYKKAMLFNRAVSQGFKTYASHLSLGYTLYTPDELDQEIDQEGEAVIRGNSRSGPAAFNNQVSDAEFEVFPHTSEQPESLDKILEGTGVSVAMVASFLGLDEKDLASPTPDELKRVRKFVDERKRLNLG